MNSSVRALTVATCVFGLAVGAFANAQESFEISERGIGNNRGDVSDRQSRSPQSVDLEVLLMDSDQVYGGLQFRFKYDNRIEHVSVDSCLGGVPDTHMGSFTACTVLPEKNEIRVTISDLGKNREIPAGLLGIISVDSSGPISEADFEFLGFEALDVSGNLVASGNGADIIQLKPVQ